MPAPISPRPELADGAEPEPAAVEDPTGKAD